MLKRLTLLILLSFTTLLILPATLHSQTTPNRAGIILDFGNGQMETRCVSFEEEQLSGYELLQRTGLPLELDASSGVGAAVCSINNVGCPGTDCFCACPGGSECVYWSYWHLNNNNWQYSGIGAGGRTIRNGDVDGWVWGPGSLSDASPPISTSFEQICPAQVNTPIPPTNTPTLPPPTNTPTPLPTYTSTPSLTPAVAATPQISFTAVDYTVQTGTCTQLQWEVQNVTAVFLDDAGVSGRDTTTVCPTQTQTYALKILHPAGEITESLTIQVVTTSASPTSTLLPPTKTPQTVTQSQPTPAATNTSIPQPTNTSAPTAASPLTPQPTNTSVPMAAPTQAMIMIQVPLASTATPLPTPIEVAAGPQTVNITPQPTISISPTNQQTTTPFDWLGYTLFTLLASTLTITLIIIRYRQ